MGYTHVPILLAPFTLVFPYMCMWSGYVCVCLCVCTFCVVFLCVCGVHVCGETVCVLTCVDVQLILLSMLACGGPRLILGIFLQFSSLLIAFLIFPRGRVSQT